MSHINLASQVLSLLGHSNKRIENILVNSDSISITVSDNLEFYFYQEKLFWQYFKITKLENEEVKKEGPYYLEHLVRVLLDKIVSQGLGTFYKPLKTKEEVLLSKKDIGTIKELGENICRDLLHETAKNKSNKELRKVSEDACIFIQGVIAVIEQRHKKD